MENRKEVIEQIFDLAKELDKETTVEKQARECARTLGAIRESLLQEGFSDSETHDIIITMLKQSGGIK